jgi:prefoldin subunit 5
LQLDGKIQQYQQQMKHLSRQIEELQGCEGDKEALDVADLRQQHEVMPSGTSCGFSL